MSSSTDLHVILHVARGTRDLLNGGPPGAILPGFFVRVFRNEGYEDILGEGQRADRQVTLEQALTIADAVDAATGLGPRVRGALLSAAEEIRKSIDAQIAVAEAAIERLPLLRESADRLRAARESLAESQASAAKWFRIGPQGGTLRWINATDESDALAKWHAIPGTGKELPTMAGPYDSPVSPVSG